MAEIGFSVGILKALVIAPQTNHDSSYIGKLFHSEYARRAYFRVSSFGFGVVSNLQYNAILIDDQ